jgi:hypothetical protein
MTRGVGFCGVGLSVGEGREGLVFYSSWDGRARDGMECSGGGGSIWKDLEGNTKLVGLKSWCAS